MSEKVVVYGADWCSDCISAKAELARLNVPYKYIDIVAHPEEKPTIEKISGVKSIPLVIFSDDSFLVEPSDEALRDKLTSLGQL